MGNRRWQQSKDRPSERPAARRPAQAPSGRGDWRQRGSEAPAVAGPSASSIKGIIGVFGFAVLVLLILLLLWWLQPVPRIRLAVLSANYDVPLLPPNAFAREDVAALASQTGIVDSSQADIDSLTREEMEARIAALPSLKPSRMWFSWEKTCTLVYVNAMGVGLWDESERRSVPYLLPAGFEVPVDNQPVRDLKAIRLRNIITNAAKSEADWKVVVLDCQRMDHCWPLGVLVNDFVDAVQVELESLKPKEKEGLFVFVSCSSGEVTWVDASRRHSAFGYYFTQGLSGIADDEYGNGDGRVDLAELGEYVSIQVEDWARRNRADTQTPTLIVFGNRPGEVSLAAVVGSPRYTPRRQDAGSPELVQRLEQQWREVYAAGRENPPPAHYAPRLWRYLQETMMRAESFLRADDRENAEKELRNATYRREDLLRAREDYAIRGRGYSIRMDQFIAQTAVTSPSTGTGREALSSLRDKAAEPKTEPEVDEATADAKDKEKSKAKSETPKLKKGEKESVPTWERFREVIEGVVDGTPLDRAAKVLAGGRFVERTPPVEALFIRMLAQVPRINDPALSRTARSLVALRLLAEEASVPEGQWAPDLFRWIRAKVTLADTERRRREDDFFASDALAVPVGPMAGRPSPSSAEQLYADGLEDSASLSEAYALRERLLAELPSVVAFGSMRPWRRAEQILTSEVVDLVEPALRETIELDNLLLQTPTSTDRDFDEITRKIRAIGSGAKQLSQRRGRLLEILAAETRDLGESTGPPRTQVEWRRINDILTVPFAAITSDPGESARLRANLVRRIRQPVMQLGREETSSGRGTRQTGSLDVDEEAMRRRATLLGGLAELLYSMGSGKELGVAEGSASQVGSKIAAAWRQLYDVAVTNPVALDDYAALVQASTARRILDGFLSRKGGYSYVRELRRLNLAQFFAWQANRFAEDFWAGFPGDNEPYFERSATGYLELAQLFAPSREFESTGRRLAQLVSVADGATIESDPAKVRFRGTDEQQVRLRVQTPEAYPTGVAALRYSTDKELIDLRALPVESSSYPYAFRLRRKGGRNDSTELSTRYFFRGHRHALGVPVLLSNDEEGPTVVYVNDALGKPGQVDVRLARGERLDLKVLFVLDCSGSMEAGNRMRIMKNVLRQFAERTPNNSIEVGVRLFGSDVVWNDPDDAAQEQAAKNDTRNVLPIGPFDQKKFDDILTDLKPTGSTPLFRALIDARKDFERVRGGRKEIIVISDGADNWAMVGQPPGVKELARAYEGQGIRINAIGFQVKDAEFTQLKEIASAGGGQVSRAERSDELLKNVTGLVGVMRWWASRGDQRYPAEAAPLQVVSKPVPVPPALYAVNVANPEGQAVATRPEIRIFAGQAHRFIYRAGAIDYADNGTDQAVARVDSAESGISLSVIRSRPRDGGLTVRFALFHPRQPGWTPEGITAIVRPLGKKEVFAFQGLPANVPGYHIPVWEMSIEDWPEDVEEAEIEVRWTETDDTDRPLVYRLQWGETGLVGKIPDGIRVTVRDFKPRTVLGKTRNSAKVKLVFPEGTKEMGLWSVAFEAPTWYARQIHNGEDAVYTGTFVLEHEVEPKTLLLEAPRPVRPDRMLKTRVPVGARSFN
ncbi:von Willebrand factor type A domain protein [Planctomycetes bacterium Pan216]|uniref:von Willebrand factor type A domain protein n=1 Tax=Kolteria novifilia TaxID=2527975 RepID=A0A518B3I1_9BACT|nr:von Willebrand factor type A domain protein [Planctomycetes bacterium Pan216]